MTDNETWYFGPAADVNVLTLDASDPIIWIANNPDGMLDDDHITDLIEDILPEKFDELYESIFGYEDQDSLVTYEDARASLIAAGFVESRLNNEDTDDDEDDDTVAKPSQRKRVSINVDQHEIVNKGLLNKEETEMTEEELRAKFEEELQKHMREMSKFPRPESVEDCHEQLYLYHKRIIALEYCLEDISRALEILSITSGSQYINAYREDADKLLETRIPPDSDEVVTADSFKGNIHISMSKDEFDEAVKKVAEQELAKAKDGVSGEN